MLSINFLNILWVNLGVIEADQSSAKGVVQIMKHLHEYIPYTLGESAEPYPILIEGDELSVERMVTTQTVMADHTLP